MQPAAVGFRVHSGWTAAVAVALGKESPLVLARQKIQLVKIFTYEFRQPYHTAEKMPPKEAARFIAEVEAEARGLARNAIKAMRIHFAERECDLTHGALLLAAGRPLPPLDRILASHALIHTADGELFRNAIVAASEHCGLAMNTFKEREILQQAGKTLRMKPQPLKRSLTDLGRPLGPPWSQDEKLSALAAWLCLLSHIV